MVSARDLSLLACCLASPAWGQTPWSPFRIGADLADSAPAPPAAAALLSRPVGFGFLWNAGNPAGAAWELEGRAVDLGIGARRTFGSWRRPLDPVARTTPRIEARAWQPVGARRVLEGTVVVSQDLLRPDGFSALAEPYASIPLVPLDTLTPSMRETAVRFEGLMGWALGRLAVGAAVGYDTRDRRSAGTPVPRFGRNVTPAAGGGAIVRLGPALALGASAAWSRRNETFRLVPRGAADEVWEVQGLGARGPINVLPQSYFRRLTTTRWEVGPEAGGTLGPMRWLLAWRLTRTSADQTSVELENPINDTWRARGSILHAAVRLAALGLVLDADGGRVALSGEARLPDLEGFIYSATESRAWVMGTLRTGALDGAWQAALTAGTARARRARRDFLYQRREEITSWTPGVTAAVAARVARATWVSADAGVATRLNAAAIPDPAMLEESYARFIGPAVAWSAAQVIPWRVGVGVRQGAGAGALVVHAAYGRATPVGELLPLQPAGDRRVWELGLRLEW